LRQLTGEGNLEDTCSVREGNLESVKGRKASDVAVSRE